MSSRADKPVADRFQNPAHGGENGFQNRLSGTGNATVAKGIEGVSEPPGNLLENPSEKNGGRTALATAERRAHPAVAEIASYYAMSRSRTPSTPAFIRGL